MSANGQTGKALPLPVQLRIFQLLDLGLNAPEIAKRLPVSYAVVANYKKKDSPEVRRKLKLQILIADSLTVSQHEQAKKLIGECYADAALLAEKMGISTMVASAVVDLEAILYLERVARQNASTPKATRVSLRDSYDERRLAAKNRTHDALAEHPDFPAVRTRWNAWLVGVLGIDEPTADAVRRVIWASTLRSSRS